MRPTIRQLATACLLTATAFSTHRLVAQDQDRPMRYRAIELKLPGRVDPLLRGDFTGNGRTDLAAVVGRTVYLYPGDNVLGFPQNHQATVKLPDETVFVTVASLPGKATSSILMMGPQGVSRLNFSGKGFDEKPVVVAKQRTLLQRGTGETVRYLDFTRYVEPLASNLVMLPTKRKLLFVKLAEGAPSAGGIDVLLDVDHYRPSGRTIAGPVTTLSYPRPYWGSFTGAGRTEAVVYRRGNLLVHGLTGEGFSARPSARLALAGSPDKGEGAFRYDYRGLPLDVADLDGDGLTDVAITETDKGRTSIFLNRPSDKKELELHQVIQVQGWTLSQKFTDLNGDGLQDLVLVRIDRVGIIEAIKVLLTKSISLTLQVFPARKLDPARPELTLYDRTPAFTRYVECPLVVSVADNRAEFGLPYIMHVGADYDGDGHGDILASTSSTELGIFRGDGKGGFENVPALRLDVPDLRKYRNAHRQVSDIDGDGRADIIITLTGWTEEEDRMIVLLSS